MARYGINTERALGISNAVLRPLGRAYEAQPRARLGAMGDRRPRGAALLSLFTDEPKQVTRRRCRALWAADVRFLGDRRQRLPICSSTPDWRSNWSRNSRPTSASSSAAPAFAMMAWARGALKKEPDATYLGWLPLIEAHAGDGRNFVKKAVNWALRQIGKRSLALHAPALALAERLAASTDKTARWIGKDAVKELTDAKTLERLAKTGERKHPPAPHFLRCG